MSIVQPAAIRIGELAPDFTARSTDGMVSLGQFRGRWLVFFSHPADFTPVCTSEFIAIANAAEQFAALDCALLGHSVDSLFSHLAWIRALRDDFGVTIPFPVVEDPTLEIAHAFGMVSAEADTAASVRAARVGGCGPRGGGTSVEVGGWAGPALGRAEPAARRQPPAAVRARRPAPGSKT